jgi:major intracellular serine protease
METMAGPGPDDAPQGPDGREGPEGEGGPGPAERVRPRPSARDRLLFVGPAVAAVAIVVVVMLVLSGIPSVDRTGWAYRLTELDAAYDQGLRGAGVRVGIVDTGIDPAHPTFDGADLVGWRDLVNGRGDPYDDEGHGTAMASIIAGHGRLRGGAPEVELIVVKVIAKDGTADDKRIADGIDYCLDPNGDGDYADGADIISLSLGGTPERFVQLIGSRTRDAVTQAVSNGVVVVAAAGNDGGPADDGEVAVPGAYRSVVCVGAVDRNGQVATFSSEGASLWTDPNRKPEVVAPGVEIATAYPGDNYAVGSGTSQATAFVTACLAAALSGTPRLLHAGSDGGDLAAVDLIKESLMTTARKVEGQDLPHDDHAGYGIVQARALAATLSIARP